jgi:hypothetical protein
VVGLQHRVEQGYVDIVAGAWVVQRRIRRDYQRLKALLEAGSDGSAS